MALTASSLTVASWRSDKGNESQVARLRSGGALPIFHAILETRYTESQLASTGSAVWEAQNRQNLESRQQLATLTSQQTTLDAEVRELQRQAQAAKSDSTKGVQAQLLKLEAETAGLTKLNTAIGDLRAAIQAQSDALTPAQAATKASFNPAIVQKWQSDWAQTPQVERAMQQIQAAGELRKALSQLQADGDKADRATLVATKKSYDEAVVAADKAATEATQKLESLKAAAEAELTAMMPVRKP